MDRQTRTVLAVVAVLAVLAWLVSFGGHLKIKARAGAAASAGDGPGLPGTGMKTGICPAKWQPHVPAGAHMGRHRMYRHPSGCSPNLTAPQQVDYDWLYSPPAQGDL